MKTNIIATCLGCRYFLQHYVKIGDKFVEADSGRCVKFDEMRGDCSAREVLSPKTIDKKRTIHDTFERICELLENLSYEIDECDNA